MSTQKYPFGIILKKSSVKQDEIQKQNIFGALLLAFAIN